MSPCRERLGRRCAALLQPSLRSSRLIALLQFWEHYDSLLASPNYLTRRQSVKVSTHAHALFGALVWLSRGEGKVLSLLSGEPSSIRRHKQPVASRIAGVFFHVCRGSETPTSLLSSSFIDSRASESALSLWKELLRNESHDAHHKKPKVSLATNVLMQAFIVMWPLRAFRFQGGPCFRSSLPALAAAAGRAAGRQGPPASVAALLG